MIASTIANYAGKTLKDAAVTSPSDFMPSLFIKQVQEPTLEADPDVQSNLIMAAMFGLLPEEKK